MHWTKCPDMPSKLVGSELCPLVVSLKAWLLAAGGVLRLSGTLQEGAVLLTHLCAMDGVSTLPGAPHSVRSQLSHLMGQELPS